MDQMTQERPMRRLFFFRVIPRGRTVREMVREADVIDLSAYRRRREWQGPRRRGAQPDGAA